MQLLKISLIIPGSHRDLIGPDSTLATAMLLTFEESSLSRTPAGRWGRPEDFKGAVVFLASGASDFVSGEILTVDGGWMGR